MQEEEIKFKNTYRIPSNRLRGYDYSQTGLYFITICTKDRKCYLGDIKEGIMYLSPIGQIVKEELLKTSEIRPNVNINEWVIMPNHVHVIIGLDNQELEVSTNIVETHCNASLQGQEFCNTFGPQSNNLASIIRGFKGATTKQINENYGYGYFSWQSRFHDHIIRTEKSLEMIRGYIRKNPETWLEDELYIR